MTMTKQYQAELRALGKAEDKIGKDRFRALTTIDKKIERLKKEAGKVERNCLRDLTIINRRAAILKGRL